MNLWVYLRGLRWLAGGFCPRCYSSPPRPDCDVCKGAHLYGYQLSPEMAMLWRARWRRLREARR